MSSTPTPRPVQQPRPKYYDLNIAHLPPGGLVSIFHRVSGVLLFFPLVPLLLYVLQVSLGTEEGYARWHDFLARPAVKLVALVFVWAYCHHFFAGIRFLFLDLHWGIAKAPARATAMLVFVVSLLATVLIAWRIW
ncbi:MAG TPA: succinate dehydrogenase, cytochrome b556 subunit [Usitatibacter sp.]|nr:succinate dehydrogenase, cytochrome b556 subunit [Usitatibacter sp.]